MVLLGALGQTILGVPGMGSPMLLVSLGWAILVVLGAIGHAMPYYWEHWGMDGRWHWGYCCCWEHWAELCYVTGVTGSTGMRCPVLLAGLG